MDRYERHFPFHKYPLSWPDGWRRTQYRKSGRFRSSDEYRSTVADGLSRISSELGKLGVSEDDLLISTNIPTRLDGMPKSDQSEPTDPGVAVYWRTKQDAPMQCMAIDAYSRVADNLCAIAATLDAMRAIERHGGAQIQERAFRGFAALPAKAGAVNWWEMLQMDRMTATAAKVEEQYRKLVPLAHPDSGGSDHAMAALNNARAEARRELGV